MRFGGDSGQTVSSAHPRQGTFGLSGIGLGVSAILLSGRNRRYVQEPLDASMEKAAAVTASLGEMRLAAAAKCVREGAAETPTCTCVPMRHWRRIRTNNTIERLNLEMRHRTRVVGTFSDGKSTLMLVTARLKYVADSEWDRGDIWTRRCWASERADGRQSPAGICAKVWTVLVHADRPGGRQAPVLSDIELLREAEPDTRHQHRAQHMGYGVGRREAGGGHRPHSSPRPSGGARRWEKAHGRLAHAGQH